MTDVAANNLIGVETPGFGLMDVIKLPITRVLFLAFATFAIFLPEHGFEIVAREGFVQNIEDQEAWSSGGNSLRRLVFLGCAAIGMISLLLGRGQRFRFSVPVFFIAAYVLWTGMSVTWSIDRPASIRRYILMLCCVIGCFGFCRFTDVKDVVMAAILVTLAYLVGGVCTEIAFGKFAPYRGEYRFAGTVHPNIQGAYLAIGSIAAFTMTRVNPKFKTVFYGIFCVLFLFLVLTKCRSATLAVPVCLGMIWVATQPTRNILVGSLLLFWGVSTLILMNQITGFDPVAEYKEILLLGRGEETGESLTGRLPLWEDLSTYIGFKPLQGYGFGAFWTPRHINDISNSQQWTISEAHSSYMDCTLQLGLVGVTLMVMTAVTSFLYSAITYRRTFDPGFLFLLGGISFCIVRSFTESRVNDPAGVSTFLFLAIASNAWVPDKKRTDTATSGGDLTVPDSSDNLNPPT